MRYKIFTILFFLFTILGATRAQLPEKLNMDSLKREAAIIKKENKELAAKTSLSSFVISNEAGGYGYCIMANGRVYIWQTTIPGMGGVKGFPQKEKAEKCAELVIKKIKEGEMPPTLTEEELRKKKLIN